MSVHVPPHQIFGDNYIVEYKVFYNVII